MLRRKYNIYEEWKRIVSHTWSGAYLIQNSGRHYRKAMRVLGKALTKAASDWTGINVWASPIVALAPPHDPLKYGTPKRYFIGDAGWNPS